jgi:ABC-type proline/glycine betaine transport system permease subunit
MSPGGVVTPQLYLKGKTKQGNTCTSFIPAVPSFALLGLLLFFLSIVQL